MADGKELKKEGLSGSRMQKGYYQNPLMEGADPFLLTYENKYYIYSTNADDGFRVFCSDNLSDWEDAGYCLRKEDVIGDKWFWAPEVLERAGKFYMVYTAEEHIAIAVSDSPLGPFVQKQKRWLSEEKAIDGHFFIDDDGKAYLYYVRFDNGNVIYVSALNDDLSEIDEQNEKMLIRAEEEWELKDCSVAEGPFVLKHGGRYYLTYSANHTRSPDYAVGCAVASSPLGPFVKYGGNPILRKNEFVNGVGHHCFARSLSGALICVYHSHYSKNQFVPRMVCIDRAEFVSGPDGVDVLTVYGPTTTLQKTP